MHDHVTKLNPFSPISLLGGGRVKGGESKAQVYAPLGMERDNVDWEGSEMTQFRKRNARMNELRARGTLNRI
jgi:hypothetical protein